MIDACKVIADFIASINITVLTVPSLYTAWHALTEETKIGVVGTSIFIGPVRPESAQIPANSIFLAVYDDDIEKTFDNASEMVGISVGLYIRAKHTTDSRLYGFLKAAIIYDLIQRYIPTTYLNLETVSTPRQLAYDEQNNAVFTLSTRLLYNENY